MGEDGRAVLTACLRSLLKPDQIRSSALQRGLWLCDNQGLRAFFRYALQPYLQVVRSGWVVLEANVLDAPEAACGEGSYFRSCGSFKNA